MDSFIEHHLKGQLVLRVEGFRVETSIREVVNTILREALHCNLTFPSVIDACHYISDMFSTPILSKRDHLFLVIHNIDGTSLHRNETQQSLSILASATRIHCLASIDHINAPFLWTQQQSRAFAWTFIDTTSYNPYDREISDLPSLCRGPSDVATKGIQYILSSLTSNHKEVLRIFAEAHLSEGEMYPWGLDFFTLFEKCRDEMIVRNDHSLRILLNELKVRYEHH